MNVVKEEVKDKDNKKTDDKKKGSSLVAPLTLVEGH
jgi:hypothetical protein